MSILVDRTSRPPGSADRPAEPTPYPVVAGALAAVQAAAAGLVCVLAPVIVTWMVSAGGDATWPQAVQLATTIWLLAQHAGVTVEGGRVGLVPLGVSLAPLAACWFAGRRMARVLDPAAERIAAGVTRTEPSLAPRSAAATFVAVYAALCLAAAGAAALPVARPVPWQAALGGAVVAVLGGGAGVAAYRFGGLRAGLAGAARAVPLPARCRRWVRPGLWALAAHVGVATLVLAVAVAIGRDQVLALHHALDPGLLGGLVLVLGQLALTPNLAVWVAAVLAGPGFAVGTGTSVTLSASVLGPLPAVPVLGALPAPGSMPGLALGLLLVPVAAGCLAGALLLRGTGEPGRWSLVADVAGAAGVAGVAFGVLAWLAGGAAGPGRLAVTGPQPALAGVVLAVEVLVGGLLAVLVRRGAPAARAALTARQGGRSH